MEDTFILIDAEGHPVQMIAQTAPGSFDAPIFFHPLARLCSKQRKYQPTLLMTEPTWDYLRDPDVTHEGAFGSDHHTIPRTRMTDLFVDATVDSHSVRWVVVWKFPGDLNHLTSASGGRAFRKILNVPLPVGEYPLYDDGWTGTTSHSHPFFPKKTMVEKMRTDVTHGNSVHFLEDRTGVKVAMIGSHFFIKEFWKVQPQEKRSVVAMINELRKDLKLHCFPCYGQHHAIVFYEWHGSIVTPRALAELLQTTELLSVLNRYSKYDLSSWSANVIRLTPKTTFASAVPTSSSHAPSTSTRTHRQPHPTGSLLRKKGTPDSPYVSQYPVPNNASVEVVEEASEFALIRYGTLEGWVRTKYLS